MSAGNDGENACNVVPARLPEAITVSATDASDARTFGNIGACVDLFAPGVNVLTAGHGGSSQAVLMSGSSFSAPLVAGAAALVVEKNIGAYTPQLVEHVLKRSATKGVVTNAGVGSPNNLLYAIHTTILISGTSHIEQPGTYTWSARPFGGDGSYSTIQWSLSQNGGVSYVNVGSGPTYTRIVQDGTGDFQLKATVSTAGETVVDEWTVRVCMGGNGGFFCN